LYGYEKLFQVRKWWRRDVISGKSNIKQGRETRMVHGVLMENQPRLSEDPGGFQPPQKVGTASVQD
jgi:hypothetical protein